MFELVTSSAGRTLICTRETASAAGGVRPKNQPPRAPSAIAASSHGIILTMRRADECATRGAAAADGAIDESSLRRNRATAISPMRALRSFSRHFWINVTTGGGVSAGSALQSGVDFTTAAI